MPSGKLVGVAWSVGVYSCRVHSSVSPRTQDFPLDNVSLLVSAPGHGPFPTHQRCQLPGTLPCVTALGWMPRSGRNTMAAVRQAASPPVAAREHTWNDDRRHQSCLARSRSSCQARCCSPTARSRHTRRCPRGPSPSVWPPPPGRRPLGGRRGGRGGRTVMQGCRVVRPHCRHSSSSSSNSNSSPVVTRQIPHRHSGSRCCSTGRARGPPKVDWRPGSGGVPPVVQLSEWRCMGAVWACWGVCCIAFCATGVACRRHSVFMLVSLLVA